MKKRQTRAECESIKTRELERVRRELAIAKHTGKKRPIQWIMVDLRTDDVSPPPNALHVVK
jgi:hypothetical protein